MLSPDWTPSGAVYRCRTAANMLAACAARVPHGKKLVAHADRLLRCLE
jgi:hypothetical protein